MSIWIMLASSGRWKQFPCHSARLILMAEMSNRQNVKNFLASSFQVQFLEGWHKGAIWDPHLIKQCASLLFILHRSNWFGDCKALSVMKKASIKFTWNYYLVQYWEFWLRFDDMNETDVFDKFSFPVVMTWRTSIGSYSIPMTRLICWEV
jgi:hypothetical protein